MDILHYYLELWFPRTIIRNYWLLLHYSMQPFVYKYNPLLVPWDLTMIN